MLQSHTRFGKAELLNIAAEALTEALAEAPKGILMHYTEIEQSAFLYNNLHYMLLAMSAKDNARNLHIKICIATQENYVNAVELPVVAEEDMQDYIIKRLTNDMENLVEQANELGVNLKRFATHLGNQPNEPRKQEPTVAPKAPSKPKPGAAPWGQPDTSSWPKRD
jgi:hypothetical protein